MPQGLHTTVRLLLWLIVLSSSFLQCKKTDDKPLTPVTPVVEAIKPGINVGLGAKLLDSAAYQKIPLFADPLAGARVAAGAKEPSLPTTYDLLANTPPVGMQGQQGSCVAWSVAYAARSYFNKVAKNVNYKASDGTLSAENLFSPSFVYNQIKLGSCLTGGSQISTALDLLQTSGVCSLKDMPYTDADCATLPSADQRQKAAAYKIKSWGRINITASAFRKYVYFDYPIIIATTLDDNFKQLKQKDANGEYIWKTYDAASAVDGHAMVLVGYDDNRKAFKIQNSWSNQWANNGYIWLSYDLIGTAAIREAYVMGAGDNSSLNPPAVRTGAATKTTAGPVILAGTITALGDEPVVAYGICASATRELPTTQFPATGKTVSSLPYSFSVTPSIAGSRIYYRAFAQTPTTIVYGDTASVTPIQSATQTNGIGKNLLLFHDADAVYALNADDGTLTWKSASGSAYNADKALSGVVSGTNFVIYGYDLRGFSLIDGTQKWLYRPTQFPQYSSFPVAADGVIYTQNSRFIVATDASTGALRWQVDVQSLGTSSTQPNTDGLTIANGKLYFTVVFPTASNYTLYAIDLVAGGNPKPTVSYLNGNPLISNDLLAYSDFGKDPVKGLRGYSLSASKPLWTSTSTNGTYPTAANNLIYTIDYTSGSKLVAIDQATGIQKWQYVPTKGNLEARTMSVSGKSVAVLISNYTGNLSNSLNKLLVFDAVTGQLRWESSDVQYSTYPLVADTKVYMLTGNSMAAYDINTGKQVWQSPDLRKGTSAPISSPLCLITKDGKAYYMPQSGMQQ